MKKVTEHSIEQYLRFPHELSAEEISEIQSAIHHSEEAKSIYEFLKAYYHEFDNLSIVQAHVIPLQAANYEQMNPGPVVLAAMSPKSSVQKLKTRATLVSEEHNALVRVLENGENQSLQFHVLCRHINRGERAILSLKQPELDLVTDENGKLKNVRELSDIRWESISSLLRLPVFKIHIDLNKKVPDLLQNVMDSNIGISHSKNKLKLEILNESSKITRVLAVQDEEVILKHIEEQKTEIDCSNSKVITLYFYE